MGDELGERIGHNVKQLREARGLTQERIAKIASVPRATWTNLESGDANPTVSVLHRVASALQVTIEELLSPPRAACEFFPLGSLPIRTQAQAPLPQLLPHPISPMDTDLTHP